MRHLGGGRRVRQQPSVCVPLALTRIFRADWQLPSASFAHAPGRSTLDAAAPRRYMQDGCAKSCGCKQQQIYGTVVESASGEGGGGASGGGGDDAPECKDRDKTGACAHWAAIGECEKNSAFMKLKCAKSCNTCAAGDVRTTEACKKRGSVPALVG